jgi:hypothetical protein
MVFLFSLQWLLRIAFELLLGDYKIPRVGVEVTNLKINVWVNLTQLGCSLVQPEPLGRPVGNVDDGWPAV